MQTLLVDKDDFLQLNSFPGGFPGGEMNGWFSIYPSEKDKTLKLNWMPSGFRQPGRREFEIAKMDELLKNILIGGRQWVSLINAEVWGDRLKYRMQEGVLELNIVLLINREIKVNEIFVFNEEQVAALTRHLCRFLGREYEVVQNQNLTACFGL